MCRYRPRGREQSCLCRYIDMSRYSGGGYLISYITYQPDLWQVCPTPSQVFDPVKERPPQSRGQLFCSALHHASKELSANILSSCSLPGSLTSRRQWHQIRVECGVLRGGKANQHGGKQDSDDRMHDDNVTVPDDAYVDACSNGAQRSCCSGIRS